MCKGGGGYRVFQGRWVDWKPSLQEYIPQTRCQLEEEDGGYHQHNHSLHSTVIILIPPLLPLTGLGISLGVEHDLRGPVPPCGNILREETSVVMLRVCYPGQTTVTDL